MAAMIGVRRVRPCRWSAAQSAMPSPSPSIQSVRIDVGPDAAGDLDGGLDAVGLRVPVAAHLQYEAV